MFHKEKSAEGPKKAVDVPLRKSDRRKLLGRAKLYFAAFATLEAEAETTLLSILDTTFMQGNLSSRSIQMDGGKAWNMILYLKTPSQDANSTGAAEAPRPDVWPYVASSQFVWMALEEKSNVVRETPTVAMWAVIASALPQLLTPENTVLVPSQVSKFVCRGADLMRAGMRTLPKGSEMAPIVAQGNPQPFAVGQIKSPQEPIGVGTKGRGVEIWNSYGDDLWRYASTQPKEKCTGKKYYNTVGGNLFDDGNYGNVGFQEGKVVLPIIDSPGDESSIEDVEDAEADDSEGHQTVDAAEQAIDVDEASKAVEQLSLTDNAISSTTSTHDCDNLPQVESPADQTQEIQEEAQTPDQTLHESVLRALLLLKNKDLPMHVGTFYAQRVIPSRPAGTTIDLKATTYKQFGQYLKVQVERGLLQAGPDKSNPRNTDPMAMLTGYFKKHDDFQGFARPDSVASPNSNEQKSKIVLVSLYTVPNHLVSLMRLNEDDVKAVNATSEERRGTGMLTASEARKILDEYVDREALAIRDQVSLDGPLTQILYKKQNDTPERLLRKDLVKEFTAKLSPAYALVEMPGSKITKLAKGAPPKIEIEVSMRQSKKFVTRVRGLEEYGIDASYFSKDVSKRLACSASIETTASSGRPALKKNHVELVFQGNIVDEIAALLVDESLSNHGGVKGSEYSVPKGVLDINLKKGVPGRKGAKK